MTHKHKGTEYESVCNDNECFRVVRCDECGELFRA